jgi:hypothetical protein
MRETLKLISLDSIWAGENPRVIKDSHIEGLVKDIGENGLIERLTVGATPNEDGVPNMVLKGHCRLLAITALAASDPDAYAKHFPEGKVRVILVKDATPEEMLAIKLDHGQQQGLTNWWELYLSFKMLFDGMPGMTEKAASVRLSNLIDNVTPLKGNKADKILKLRQAVKDADGQKARWEAEKKRDEEQFQTRRGLLQVLNRVRRAPHVIAATMCRTYTGRLLEGFKESQLMEGGLTNRQIGALYEAHKLDTALDNPNNLDSDDCPKYNQDVPGPNFWKAWKDIQEEKSKTDPSKKRPKSLSSNAILEPVKDGQIRSKAGQLLSQHHAGREIDVAAMREADARAYYADVLSKHDPEYWAACVERATALAAEASEASKVAAQEAASKEEVAS